MTYPTLQMTMTERVKIKTTNKCPSKPSSIQMNTYAPPTFCTYADKWTYKYPLTYANSKTKMYSFFTLG